MLKEKLKAAVAELQKVYQNVVVRPSCAESGIDIILDRAGAVEKSTGSFECLKILAAHGLQPRGFVSSQQLSKLFLRDISELIPESCSLTPEEVPNA